MEMTKSLTMSHLEEFPSQPKKSKTLKRLLVEDAETNSPVSGMFIKVGVYFKPIRGRKKVANFHQIFLLLVLPVQRHQHRVLQQ